MGSESVLGHVVAMRAALVVFVLLAPMSGTAAAQFELAGSWAARNTEDISRDSFPVDYIGLPLNDEARTRALTYNESQLAMVERQCEGWPQFYFVQGPFGLKIWSDSDPVRGGVDLLHRRRLGGPRADDDLDGRAAAAVDAMPSTRAPASRPAAGKATRSWRVPRT